MKCPVRLPLALAMGALGCPDEPAPTPRDATAEAAPDAAAPDVAAPEDVAADDVAAPPPPRRFLRDPQGRALILHGANVGSKDPPDHVPAITPDDVARMADVWGFNFVRYLIFWDAAEPAPGRIDGAYLDAVARQLDVFAARGMSVMLDLHQDVYARRFCCDGAPEWAIADDGLPFKLQTTWSLNYLQPAVERAFDNFWAYDGPHRDLQDHYGDVWVAVARRFRDHPAVVGYDLINEPSPGSLFDPLEPARGVGGGEQSPGARFDRTLLAPFYRRLIARIRAVDPDRYVFVEPRFGAAGAGAVQYIPALADPRAGEGRVAFAPHLYSLAYEAASNYNPAIDRTVARWEAARAEETRVNDWPIVMGEFGMDQTFPGAARYLDDVLEMADRAMVSWAYWAWSPGTWGFWDPAAGAERPNLAQLVRAYPRRVAGTPERWSWDRQARVFTLTFRGSAEVTAPTEIFVPAARFYPGGYALTVSDPDGAWSQSWDAARQVLSITTRPGPESHTVTLGPR